MIMADLDNLINSEVGEYSVSSDIDPTELAIGVQTEMEHTNDLKIAKEIALDHLSHHPNYYSELAKAGLSRDFDSKPSSGYGDPDAGFNDASRVGDDLISKTNMGGSIGDTPIGKVDGRRCEPVHNKTIDIELQEKTKKSPKPKNPKLWAKAKSLAKSKFDTWPSAYASGWAAKWYKGKGGKWKMSESNDLDKNFKKSVDVRENNNIMKKSKLKDEIKKIVRDSFLKENDDLETTDMETSDVETTETVTITLDKELVKTLHDVLMASLQPEDESSEESELTPVDNQDYEEESGEESGEESINISEAKKIVSRLKSRK